MPIRSSLFILSKIFQRFPVLKKLDTLNPQTRILIAVALALAFFIPYSYFFAPSPKETNATTTEQNTQAIQTPKTETTTPQEVANQAQNLNNPQGAIIAKVVAENFEYEIDRLGRISQVYLKNKQYQKDEKSDKLALFGEEIQQSNQNNPKTLEIRFSDQLLNQQAFNTPYQASDSEILLEKEPKTLTLTQELGELRLEKIITFYPNGYYELQVNLPQNHTYFLSPGMRPVVEEDTYVFKGVIIKENDGTITTIEDDDAKGQTNHNGTSILAGVDRYYTTLFFKKDSTMESIILSDSKQNPMPFISAKGNFQVSGYIGPKDYRLLQSISPELTDVVEYGIITFFAKPLFLLLDKLYSLCGNWGWAIILLTLIVRIVLYPLTYKGMVSMQKLKEIAPKMKELQQKYKGEPQKLQMHMMELYKKHGANPMGGCLPILLQMPVFFAIYRVLYNAIELKGAEWLLWIDDLSKMDPYFVLPILMGGTMYLQQHLTPTAFNDPMQEKVFKFLPLIFTIFFITFPSGLVLYWFVNNIFSILQQLLINKTLERKKAREIAEHKHEKEIKK